MVRACFLSFAIVVVSACVTPGAHICDNGLTCPESLVCDEANGGCVEPEQLTVCAGMADRAECTAPTEYTVKLKPGLKFANGHALTSSDVKFSIDRAMAADSTNAQKGLFAQIGAGGYEPRAMPWTRFPTKRSSV